MNIDSYIIFFFKRKVCFLRAPQNIACFLHRDLDVISLIVRYKFNDTDEDKQETYLIIAVPNNMNSTIELQGS